MKEKHEFGQLIEHAREHYNRRLPFVLFRYPNEPTVNGIFQQTDEVYNVLDFTEEGFVFAPFKIEKPPILVQPHQQINAIYKSDAGTGGDTNNKGDADREKHLKLVSKGITAIRSGQLQKVVLSHSISANTEKDCFLLYQSMLSKYHTAFCSLWYHPKVGCWLGATPERLLTRKGNRITTISLAGTLRNKKGSNPEWSPKELEEQRLVTDYLVQHFSKRLDRVQTTKPESVRAGNLWHLKSAITGTVKADDFLLIDLINDLHPTPAVCGVPKELAYNFILENEGYDREFYTGYLGYINAGEQRDTQLFVNLRCLQWKEDEVQIYVGGGITGRSHPEDEWNETSYKSQTMWQLL